MLSPPQWPTVSVTRAVAQICILYPTPGNEAGGGGDGLDVSVSG